MANENSKGGSAVAGSNDAARKEAMKAGRAVLSAKLSKLSDEEQAALRVIKSATSSIETLRQRVLNRQPISGEALRACSMLTAEMASVLFK